MTDHNIYINKIDQYLFRVSQNTLILIPKEIRVSREELLQTPLTNAKMKSCTVCDAHGRRVSSGATRFRVLLNEVQAHLNQTHVYSSKTVESQLLLEALTLMEQYQYSISLRIQLPTSQTLVYEN